MYRSYLKQCLVCVREVYLIVHFGAQKINDNFIVGVIAFATSIQHHEGEEMQCEFKCIVDGFCPRVYTIVSHNIPGGNLKTYFGSFHHSKIIAITERGIIVMCLCEIQL